ncbi:hypothetical protein ASF63_15690 [Microbacterium sp. Leaf320]|nr:hypothetical protein ASF63_15690 [Microbacterium sp. Leaf320]
MHRNCLLSGKERREDDDEIEGSREGIAAVAALLMAVGGLVVPTSASAETSPPAGHVRTPQTWYLYAGAGETVSTDFTKVFQVLNGQMDPTVVITRPDGSVASECALTAADPVGSQCAFTEVAAGDGVWSVALVAPEGQETAQGRQVLDWDISVYDGGEPRPGRVWTERYAQYDLPLQPAPLGGPVDLTLWYLTEQGYIYEVDRLGMQGIDSIYTADAFGVVDPATCASAHSSTAGRGYQKISNTTCRYTPFKMFFAAPADDLPAQVTLPTGETTWLSTPPVTPTLDAVTFTQDTVGSRSGTIEAVFSNFEGSALVHVDADGDGAFDGPNERTTTMGIVGGEGSVVFDGLDAVGNPIPYTTPVAFRVSADGFAEVHFSDQDTEVLGNGIQVRRLNGPADGTETRIFWDDTHVTSAMNDPQADLKCSATAPLASGVAGVDSAGGVH